MKTCSTCGREFLDSYESCPFCARASTTPAPAAAPPPERHSRGPLGPALVGVAILVLAVGAWQLFGAYMGGKAVLAADGARCFAKQVEAERGVMVQAATHDYQPVTTLAQLVPAQFEAVPKCPSGGSYTLAWDPERPKVACSKHGWHGDQER